MSFRQNNAVPPAQAHPPLYSHSTQASRPFPQAYPYPYPYPPPYPYPYPHPHPASYPHPSYGQQHPKNGSSQAYMGHGPPPVIPPPSAPLRSHKTPRAPVDHPHPGGYGIKLTGPPPPSTYLWNPRGPEYQNNPVSADAAFVPPNQTYNTSHPHQNFESHPHPPIPAPNQGTPLPPPVQSGHSTSEGRNNTDNQGVIATTVPEPPAPRVLSTQDVQGHFDFPPRRAPVTASDSAGASEAPLPSSARDNAGDAKRSRRQSSSSVIESTTVDQSTSHQNPPSSLEVKDKPYGTYGRSVEMDKRVPPDTRSPHVRPLKSILRKPVIQQVELPSCCRAPDYKGKGKDKERKKGEVPASSLSRASDSKGKGKEGEQVVWSRDGPSDKKTSDPAFISNKENSEMSAPRPPTPGTIMRDPNFEDKSAPAHNRHHQPRSLPVQPDKKNSDNFRREARMRLNPLLLNAMPNFPALDWDITLPVPRAKKWTPQCYCVPLSRADLHETAVDPPISELYIFTDKHRSPAASFAFSQWGPIHIHPRAHKDDSMVLPFVTTGDILQGIHQYFSTHLTTSEMQRLKREMVAGAFKSRSERSAAASRTDSERANEIASAEPLRADELFGYLNYGGLEMGSDFLKSKMLYLKLDSPERRR